MTPAHAAHILQFVGWGFIAFGIIFTSTAFPGLDGAGWLLIDIIDWPANGMPEVHTRETRWLAAIGGGLTCALGVFIAHITAPLIKGDPGLDPRRLAKRGTLIALTLWLVVDSAGSVASGVPVNVLFNTLFYSMVAIPLMLVKFN